MGYIFFSVKESPELCKEDAIQVCKMISETMVNGNLKDDDP